MSEFERMKQLYKLTKLSVYAYRASQSATDLEWVKQADRWLNIAMNH